MAEERRRGVWLHYLSHEIAVPMGEFVIGRGKDCQLSLDDASISRRHALLHARSEHITIEDLGSYNGVFVNGSPVRGVCTLSDGDEITLGSQKMRLEMRGPLLDAVAPDSGPTSQAGPSSHRAVDTVRPSALPSMDDDGEDDVEPTRLIGAPPRSTPQPPDARVNSLTLIGGIANKALARKRPLEAARILGQPLRDLLAQAEAGKPLSPELATQAGLFAAQLAAATGSGLWIDYIVRLYSALGCLIPLSIIDRLYNVVRHVGRFDLLALRAYVDKMRERAPSSGPANRFVQQRLEGLERLAANVVR